MVLDALVDIEVEVRVLYREVYQMMDFWLSLKECIIMLQAGEDFKLEGFIVGLFSIYIGSYFYEEDLRVVFLKDRMLLGLDVLFNKRVRFDLDSGVMELGDEIFMMNFCYVKCQLEYFFDVYGGYDVGVGRVLVELEFLRFVGVGVSYQCKVCQQYFQ